MSAKVFLDTNIWIYAAGAHDDAPEKQRRAAEIIAREDIVISTQIVGEFINVSQKAKRSRRPMTSSEAAAWVDRMFELPTVEVDREIVMNAMVIQRRYGTPYWDSQMIACAERSGAAVLYSEDLAHRQKYGALRCVNPFVDH
jgi:predicted nucleic acid-binding protein